MSQERNGIGSAMADPDDHLHTLQVLGWVTVVHTPERGTGLHGPTGAHPTPKGSDEPFLRRTGDRPGQLATDARAQGQQAAGGPGAGGGSPAIRSGRLSG